MSELRFYSVTITDVVDWTATIEAASEADADALAWQMFACSERDQHFHDRCETTIRIKEVAP